MVESVKTDKGTTLPLMNLKGKPYMMVAHRIVWFNESVKNYSITTEFLERTGEYAAVKATVKVMDETGKVLKEACGTKCEEKKSFPDFVEKAETGAIGRAITTLGYGTAYALADLDEGSRIIDAPVTTATASSGTVASNPTTSAKLAEAKASVGATKIATFRKKKTEGHTANGTSNGSTAGESARTSDDGGWS